MVKQGTVIIDALYPIVSKNLSNPHNIKKLDSAIADYVDKNSEAIYDIGLAKKIFFLNTDKEVIYQVCGLEPKQIKAVIKQSKYIASTWQILNEPLNIASVLILRYFAKNKKDKNLERFLIYYSFYFYASLHYKYLPFGANENVMTYTINHLSNKFKIKEAGSLFETIKHTSTKSNETYLDDLIRGEDGDLAKYISAIKVRLNDLVKNIKNEYTNNYKEDKFFNSDNDDYSEENFHVSDNTSFAIKRISEASLMRLMTYGADMSLAKLAANLSQVSQNEIRSVIINLSDSDNKEILRMSELILQLYLMDEQNTTDEVRTKKFLISCMEIYKKSNTNDKIILEIKAILDKWLKKYSSKYRATNREATMSNFRRSIFIYFVLHIQISSR